MDRRSRRQNRAVRVRIGLWYPCEDLGEVEAGKEAALPATLTNPTRWRRQSGSVTARAAHPREAEARGAWPSPRPEELAQDGGRDGAVCVDDVVCGREAEFLRGEVGSVVVNC